MFDYPIFPADDRTPEAPTPETPSSITQKLQSRYSNAYTEAHAVITVGKLIKGIGICLFVILTICGFVLASQQRGGGGIKYIIGGFILGCIVAIPVYVLGILVAAQGQTALATLDTAVNSSRHLTDDDVAKILTKRWSL